MYKFKTEPWEHQLKALDYLMVRRYGALYTDMGTGKTKVGIDLVINRDFELTVIVGTKKSCEVWVDEFNTHCSKDNILLFRLDLLSTKKKTSMLDEIQALIEEKQHSIVLIINYDSIWRKPFSEKLITFPIDCVICDESHRIKAPASKCSLYLARLGHKVQNRFLFTGTPSPEKPLDVYAQYRFLQPSIFGTRFIDFRERYENLDVTKSLRLGYRCLQEKKPYKNLEELKEKMYSCAFYVESSVELPSTTDIIVKFTPNQKTIEAYKELVKEGVYEDEDGVLETNNSLARALREQEILSGYIPMEDVDFTRKFKKKIDTSRQEALIDLLQGINPKEKIVVFAKFKFDFKQIQKICKKLGKRYGEISGNRDDYSLWKKDKIDLLAVHYKSGSESIDLTKARYCIYYDPSYSYSLYAQSRKRVHRPGQKRPVTYYTLIATIPKMTTVDQKIMKALALKKDLSDYLLG